MQVLQSPLNFQGPLLISEVLEVRALRISTDATNLPGPLVISELSEVRAGGCGGLAPRPPGKRLVCFEFILILSEIPGPAV